MELVTYEDFLGYIDDVGFLPLSSNSIGMPSLESLTREASWHTGLETDPWRWKDRAAGQRRVAYAKLFRNRPGFVSLEWYPVFLAARRQGKAFLEVYREGLMSHASKIIYSLFDEEPVLATHEIKARGGFRRENKSQYESAMAELQMRMFITTNGTARILGKNGEPHSWPATAYTTVESWANEEIIEKSRRMSPEDSARKIAGRILSLVPDAPQSKVQRLVLA